MIIINLHPIVSVAQLTLSVTGDILTINGEDLDLSVLNEGDTLPAGAVDHDFLRAYEITRSGGDLHVGILFPIRPDAGDAARFPQPIHVTTNGPVTLPGGAS